MKTLSTNPSGKSPGLWLWLLMGSLLLLIWPGTSHGQTEVNALFYSFDSNPVTSSCLVLEPAGNQNISFSISIASLTPGLHILNLAARDESGIFSLNNQTAFIRQPIQNAEISHVEYFVDTDPGEGLGTNVPLTSGSNQQNLLFSPEISLLSYGCHYLFTRAEDETGKWSLVNCVMFVHLPLISPVKRAEYFVDTDPGEGNAFPLSIISSNNLSSLLFSIDKSQLSPGFHQLFVRAQDAPGSWSLLNHELLFVEPSISPVSMAEFFVDNDPGEGQATPISLNTGLNTGNLAFSIDKSTLSKGLHHLYVRGKDSSGQWSITNHLVVLNEPGNLPDLQQLEYFVDTDPGAGKGQAVDISASPQLNNTSFAADISSCSMGGHVVGLRSRDSNGSWSLTNLANFNKVLKPVIIKVLPEGLYNPLSGKLNKAQDENGDHCPALIADQVTAEVRSAESPGKLVLSQSALNLNTSGIAYLNVPDTMNGAYYLVIRHRNSIETCSSQPVSFESTAIAYDFSSQASQSYGSNLKEVSPGVFCLYGGDVNQDGLVDAGDLIPVDNLNRAFGSGYIPEDANGDGFVDASDMILIDNNSKNFIGSILPF